MDDKNYIICSQESTISIIKDNNYNRIKKLEEELNKLKNINDIYEKEINLLKTSILINNLNIENTGRLNLLNNINEIKNNQLSENIKKDSLYDRNTIINHLIIKINNFKEELDLFKVEFSEAKNNFISKLNITNEQIKLLCKNEVEKRKKIEDKISNIEKLI